MSEKIPLPAQGTPDTDEVTLLEDVLPSFEMHNYMFNRTIYDNENIILSGNPPSYDDLNLGTRTTVNNDDTEGTYRDLNNFVDDPTRNPNLLLLNNLEKFQRIDLPLSIQVVLTKSASKLGVKPERENPLRQYKPGEIVYGYIIIENKSEEEIPFEMLLVSLEGQTTVSNSSKPDDLRTKTFLKTYDLSACFHYGFIQLESQGITMNTRFDPVDNCYMGFDNNRMIYPKTKHKKFFSFKLPKYLLDNSCPDQLPNHLKLPPSFGVDNKTFGGLARYIKVDPIQGYGRLDRYGSPIRTDDHASDGQSVSYFINVQFIGRKLEFYKKFYTHETTHEYDFIFLKNIEYNFRVDPSSSSTALHEYSVDDTLTELSTFKQFKIIEKLITDKLNEVVERKNLKQIGICDLRKQDEIIFGNDSNNKKMDQLYHYNSDDLVPVLSDVKPVMVDNDKFSRIKNVKIVKDLFSKVEGDLIVRVSMNKNLQMKSIKPRQLKLASIKATSMKLNTSSSSCSSLLNLQPTLSSPTFSTISLHSLNLAPSNSVDTVIDSYSSKSCESIFVHLSFESKKSAPSKANLPSTITLTPSLKMYNIQSPYPIPITFDNEFIFNKGLERENIQNLNKKFQFYYQQMVDTLRELEIGLARSMYNKLNSISRMSVSEHHIKKLFESHTVDLHNQWKFNEKDNIYECEFQIPLSLDPKAYEKISSYCIVPTFQQCLVSRLYAVEIDISAKRARTKVGMGFPITVV